MDIFGTIKTIRNGLAIYGGLCLVAGVADRCAERSIIHLTDNVCDALGIRQKERVIEADFKEVT